LVQFLVNDAHELVFRLRAREELSMDEKCRRALYAQPLCFVFIFLDGRFELATLQAFLEIGWIESELGSIRD